MPFLRKFHCPECGREFPTQAKRNDHVSTSHPNREKQKQVRALSALRQSASELEKRFARGDMDGACEVLKHLEQDYESAKGIINKARKS